eukprot:10753156-Prorocentrum_lima.AAC.1
MPVGGLGMLSTEGAEVFWLEITEEFTVSLAGVKQSSMGRTLTGIPDEGEFVHMLLALSTERS